MNSDIAENAVMGTDNTALGLGSAFNNSRIEWTLEPNDASDKVGRSVGTLFEFQGELYLYLYGSAVDFARSRWWKVVRMDAEIR